MAAPDLSSIGELGGFGLSGPIVPLAFEAGDIPAWLDATAWYDLFYVWHEANPTPLTLATILQAADAVWYDLKDATS